MSSTILRGGDGHPVLLVRDQDWRVQVAAERRQKQDEEIKTLVAQIERDADTRRYTPPLSAAELADCSVAAKGYTAGAATSPGCARGGRRRRQGSPVPACPPSPSVVGAVVTYGQ